MNPWFRFYHESLDDPKVQKLPHELFRAWINCLCLAARNDGFIPSLSDVSFAFRESPEKCSDLLEKLEQSGLIDRFKNNVLRPHNWESRQFKSDLSTDRVKRFRKRFRNRNETPHETDQNRTEQNRENPPISPPLESFGEFGNVKLTSEQHAKLIARLDGNLQNFIDRLDRWGQEEPGKFRKKKSHYATILNWFDRDVKDGKVKTAGRVKREPPSIFDSL